MRSRLAARGSGRDTAKLADLEAFTASMGLDAEPAAPHTAIDNRLTSAATLEAQVAALVERLSGHRADTAQRGMLDPEQY